MPLWACAQEGIETQSANLRRLHRPTHFLDIYKSQKRTPFYTRLMRTQ